MQYNMQKMKMIKKDGWKTYDIHLTQYLYIDKYTKMVRRVIKCTFKMILTYNGFKSNLRGHQPTQAGSLVG
jgi:hypothetical protein